MRAKKRLCLIFDLLIKNLKNNKTESSYFNSSYLQAINTNYIKYYV